MLQNTHTHKKLGQRHEYHWVTSLIITLCNRLGTENEAWHCPAEIDMESLGKFVVLTAAYVSQKFQHKPLHQWYLHIHGTIQNSVIYKFCLVFSECVAGITFCCFVYLQNTIRFVSENTESVFAVLLSVK